MNEPSTPTRHGILGHKMTNETKGGPLRDTEGLSLEYRYFSLDNQSKLSLNVSGSAVCLCAKAHFGTVPLICVSLPADTPGLKE